MSDNYIAVRNYSYQVKELKTDDLKDAKFDFDKVVTSNINHQLEHYPVKSFVYYPSKNVYLQIKKYDEERKIYTCRTKHEEI